MSSTVVLDELMAQEHPRQNEKIALLTAIPLLDVNDDILEIVEVYQSRKVIPRDPAGDALHLAFASYYNCDILLTWNCVHLPNANKFEHIRRVNVTAGVACAVALDSTGAHKGRLEYETRPGD